MISRAFELIWQHGLLTLVSIYRLPGLKFKMWLSLTRVQYTLCLSFFFPKQSIDSSGEKMDVRANENLKSNFVCFA